MVPVHDEPYQQRVAEVLHILASVVLGLCLITIALTPFVYTRPLVGLSFTGTTVFIIIAILVINKRGRPVIGAHVFIYLLWILDTTIIVLSGGIQSAFLPVYISIAVMGGLLLGGTAIFHFAGISVLATILIYFLGVQGLLPDPIMTFNLLALVIISIATLLLPALTLYIVIYKYEDTVQQLVDNEETLSKTNLELTWEIQARKEAESLQQHSEHRFRSALMESPIPILLHADDGEIILVNHSWVEKSGYKDHRLETLADWLSNCFRDQALVIDDEIKKIVKTHISQAEGDYILYTEDGAALRWYLRLTQLPDLPDGRRLVLTMATDMTNLLDVELALRESEENLSRFSLLTNDGIWDWDLRTDKVIFDPLYYTMAGYEVDEFPHELVEFRKRVHPEDVERVFSSAEAHLEGSIDIYSEEFRFLKKDGTWLWILGRGKITEQDENGNPLRFVGTHTDISAQKTVEEELSLHQLQLEDVVEDRTQRLNERITEVERLNLALTNILDDYQIANEKLSTMSASLTETYDELESFTYSVSNDLRRPLKNLQKSAGELSLKHKGDLTKKAQSELDQVIQNSEMMDQLINDLLQLSQLGKVQLDLTDVDPSEIVNEIIQTYADEIETRKIKIETEDLPSCHADRKLLSLVLQNLVSNAIKFTLGEKKPSILIGYQPDQLKERVVYYVKDNGIGFNMNKKEVVFDTFQRLHTHKEFEGTGAGLAVVKKIVNRHGGEIWVEAEEKKGATFYFDLERSDG